jgi:rod shape-determining protein MreC
LRACLLVFLAILFITLDHRSPSFHRLRQNVAVIVLPIQFVVNAPIQWLHWLGAGVIAQKHLLKENAQLKARESLLKSKLQELLVLERENSQLKVLLKSTSHIASRVKVAQLLAVDLDPTVQQIILDKGWHDHVYRGQPVLDAYGVMGQVVDVGPFTSKVLLLTDPRFAIPVNDERNGFRAIAAGTGVSQRLTLLHVNDKHAVKVGDLLVTSGLGLHFPVGYPVAIVASVEQLPGKRFIQVTLIPHAHLDITQQVILAWPDKAVLNKSVQAELDKPVSTVTQ